MPITKLVVYICLVTLSKFDKANLKASVPGLVEGADRALFKVITIYLRNFQPKYKYTRNEELCQGHSNKI